MQMPPVRSLSIAVISRLSCRYVRIALTRVAPRSNWDFFTDADPTHGLVNFVDGDAAKKLAYVQSDNTVVLAVDDSDGIPVGGKRNSIRISSKKAYTRGLFVADIFAMPHGCGVWPAYWSLGTGKDWPNAGEIDIIGEFSCARRLLSVAGRVRARICACPEMRSF